MFACPGAHWSAGYLIYSSVPLALGLLVLAYHVLCSQQNRHNRTQQWLDEQRDLCRLRAELLDERNGEH